MRILRKLLTCWYGVAVCCLSSACLPAFSGNIDLKRGLPSHHFLSETTPHWCVVKSATPEPFQIEELLPLRLPPVALGWAEIASERDKFRSEYPDAMLRFLLGGPVEHGRCYHVSSINTLVAAGRVQNLIVDYAPNEQTHTPWRCSDPEIGVVDLVGSSMRIAPHRVGEVNSVSVPGGSSFLNLAPDLALADEAAVSNARLYYLRSASIDREGICESEFFISDAEDDLSAYENSISYAKANQSISISFEEIYNIDRSVFMQIESSLND